MSMQIDPDVIQMGPKPKPRNVATRSRDGQHIETPAHARAFEVWMEMDQSFPRASKELGIAHMALRRYAVWFDWEERARRRYQVVAEKIQENGVETATKMLETHFEAGALLIDRGARFLIENGINNERDAIRAIEVGVRLQRQVQELPDWVTKTSAATTSDLLEQAREIARQLSAQERRQGAIDVDARSNAEQSALSGGATISGALLGDREGIEIEGSGAERREHAGIGADSGI